VRLVEKANNRIKYGCCLGVELQVAKHNTKFFNVSWLSMKYRT